VGKLLPVVRAGPEETLAGALIDLDGDGLNDAVYTNQQAATLTIWWGQRGGILVEGARTEIPAGRSSAAPSLLVTAGTRTLILPRPDTGDLARWRVENRAFIPLEPIPQPGSPRAAVLVHWDDDPDLDLLVNTEPCLMVRRGDGAGGFPTGTCVAMQPYAEVKGALDIAGRRLAMLVGDDRVALYDGGADGAPHVRERLPFASPFHGDLARAGAAEVYRPFPDAPYLARWRRRMEAPVGATNAWDGCLWATGQLDGFTLLAVDDHDGDSDPEVIGSRTCAGCTSNQVAWRR
jgi:hypothetical protein